MDSLPDNSSLDKGEIRFPNDNRAIFVKASAKDNPAELIKALGIKKPVTVLLLIGGADELDPALNARIESLLENGLALAAADTNALIIDGGTKSGVMQLMGKVIALQGRVTPLLGIAPAGKVTYPGGPAARTAADRVELDPNHSHFVLVEGEEWSSGTEVMFRLARKLATEARVVVVLVNGGDETRDEVRRAAKLGWPIVVIQGSGRLADEIATEVTFAHEGNFEVFDLSNQAQTLKQTIIRHAEGALIEAWRRFAQYDSNAKLNRARHIRLLSLTLATGVLGTLFALGQKQFVGLEGRAIFVSTTAYVFAAAPILVMGAVSMLKIFKPKSQRIFLISWGVAVLISAVLLVLVRNLGDLSFLNYAVLVFKYLAIGVPVIVSVLMTASNQFKNRRKWILLREGAEAIKQEMFRYRTRIGEYADEDKSATPSKETDANAYLARDIVLANKLVAITERLMRTEVNAASLQYEESGPPADALARSDDGFSFLTPERYLQVRLEDQLSFYQGSTNKLERQRLEFQSLILIVGGAGTLLAALGAELWIALTTATVTALSAWVSNLKLDLTLVKYNQSAGALSNLRLWWNTLPLEDKAKPANKETLVNGTEQILASERLVWVQQMEEATEEDNEAAKQKKKQG